MRKKISCKIIKSVPFDSGDNRLRQSFSANMQQPKISSIGNSTYTPHLLVTTICNDDSSAAQILDCCA